MLFPFLIASISSFSIEDLANADTDVLAQAFMERCLDQGGEETACRAKTIEMFGTSGNTRIDINIGGSLIDGNRIGNIISRGSRDLRSRTVPRSECTQAHTIYYGGQCHCRLFYDYGDPIETGCWRCRPRCHASASCTQHRGCVCNNFTLGDGYKKCETHIPHIVRAYTKPDKKTVIVDIKAVKWTSPTTAFCKFNNIIIEGTLIGNNTIKCVRKNKKKKNTKVEISWDSITFSHQEMPVIDFEDTETDYFGPIVLGIVIIFIALAVYVMFIYKRGTDGDMDLESYADNAMKTGKL